MYFFIFYYSVPSLYGDDDLFQDAKREKVISPQLTKGILLVGRNILFLKDFLLARIKNVAL